jgi:hypothetical protein
MICYFLLDFYTLFATLESFAWLLMVAGLQCMQFFC